MIGQSEILFKVPSSLLLTILHRDTIPSLAQILEFSTLILYAKTIISGFHTILSFEPYLKLGT